MKNSVNQHSVLPVSFECIDGKRFRFHQIGPMTHLKKRFSKNFFFWKSWSGGGGLSPSHVFMFSLFMFSRTISNVSFEPANHFFIRCMHFDRVVHEVWPCNIQKGKQNWRTHQKVNKHWKYRKVTTGYKKGYSTKLLVKSYTLVTLWLHIGLWKSWKSSKKSEKVEKVRINLKTLKKFDKVWKSWKISEKTSWKFRNNS